MKINNLLIPIRENIRQGNLSGTEFELSRLLLKAAAAETSPKLKIEIYLEVIKALRVLNRVAEAENFAEVAVSNIPTDSLSILSAINRLRALIALDRCNLKTARQIIDQTDGLEMVLEGAATHIIRKDEDIQAETWLVSCEVALAEGDLEMAELSHQNALKKMMAGIEKSSGSRNPSPMERQALEQYRLELEKTAKIFQAVIGLQNGDVSWNRIINDYYGQEMQANAVDPKNKKGINLLFESRLKCLTQRWMDDGNPPPGLSLAEARRWQKFGQPNGIKKENVVSKIENTLAEVIPENEVEANLPKSPDKTDSTLMAVEKMATALGSISNILPNFQNLLEQKDKINYSQRGFSGHLLDADLETFMRNFENLRFNGYLKLIWHPQLYRSLVIADVLPQVVESGEAILYIQNGVIIDVTFAGDYSEHTPQKAQDYLLLVVRITLKIGVDKIDPDILGSAIPDESVTNRKPLLNVTHNELFMVASDLEAKIAGIEIENSALDLTNDLSSMFLSEEEFATQKASELNISETSQNKEDLNEDLLDL